MKRGSKYLYKVLASGPVQDHRNRRMNVHLHQKVGGAHGGVGGATEGWAGQLWVWRLEAVFVLLIRTVFPVNTVTTGFIVKVRAPVLRFVASDGEGRG